MLAETEQIFRDLVASVLSKNSGDVTAVEIAQHAATVSAGAIIPH
jgi:hypothetical protein